MAWTDSTTVTDAYSDILKNCLIDCTKEGSLTKAQVQRRLTDKGFKKANMTEQQICWAYFALTNTIIDITTQSADDWETASANWKVSDAAALLAGAMAKANKEPQWTILQTPNLLTKDGVFQGDQGGDSKKAGAAQATEEITIFMTDLKLASHLSAVAEAGFKEPKTLKHVKDDVLYHMGMKPGEVATIRQALEDLFPASDAKSDSKADTKPKGYSRYNVVSWAPYTATQESLNLFKGTLHVDLEIRGEDYKEKIFKDLWGLLSSALTIPNWVENKEFVAAIDRKVHQLRAYGDGQKGYNVRRIMDGVDAEIDDDPYSKHKAQQKTQQYQYHDALSAGGLYGRGGRGRGSGRGACYICGLPGHFARSCPTMGNNHARALASPGGLNAGAAPFRSQFGQGRGFGQGGPSYQNRGFPYQGGRGGQRFF